MGAFFVIIGLIIGGFIGIVVTPMFMVGKEDNKMDEFYRQRKEKYGAKKTKKTQGK